MHITRIAFFLRIAWLRLGSGVNKFRNQISPTWFPFILRSLMRLVRFLRSGYILNLFHKFRQMHATRIEFYERVSNNMKRVSVRLVPIETRSFNSYDFFIWLHHVTSCPPACLSILPDACNQNWVLWKSVNNMKQISVRLVPVWNQIV